MTRYRVTYRIRHGMVPIVAEFTHETHARERCLELMRDEDVLEFTREEVTTVKHMKRDWLGEWKHEEKYPA
jgi:hypothetical protein